MELSSVQDVRSTLNMPRVEDVDDGEPPSGLEPASLLEPVEDLLAGFDIDLAATDADGDPDADADADADTDTDAALEAGGHADADSGPGQESEGAFEVQPRHVEGEPTRPASHAYVYPKRPVPTATYPAASVAALDDEPSTFHAATDDYPARRKPRRRGLGLMVTGGCAGVAIVGFLVLGGGGSNSPAGVAVTRSGTLSNTAGPANGAPSTGSQANLGTASFAAVATGSSTSATTAPSTSAKPSHSASTAPSSSQTAAPPATSAPPPTSTAPSAPASPPHSAPSSTPAKTCYILCL